MLNMKPKQLTEKKKRPIVVNLARNWQKVKHVYLVRGFDRYTPNTVFNCEVEILLAGVWVKTWEGDQKEYFIPHIHIDRIEL